MDTSCICTTLRQAAAQSTAYYDAALAPSGIKVTTFRLLKRIEHTKSISISALADIVGLDRSTLGRNLRVIEKQDLVKMSSGEDGRARIVSLTADGHAALQAATPLWEAAQHAYGDLLGAEALALLERIVDETKPSTSPGHRA